MSRNVYPFLSGTLRAVIEELSKKNDPIAKEIFSIDKDVEDLLRIKNYVPLNLRDKIIEKILDDRLTGEVSMLSVRIGGDDPNISFLPKDKEPEYTADGTWARRNRQDGKPARIFQKALVKQFKQQEWEVFSNAFKAEVCNCNNFELVSGEDIRKWYNEENYYESKGTLGNSCMRYPSAQDYFDVYVDKAKMLITKRAGRLTGRAIVWEIDENTTILDRVYTCFDYLYNCFIDYAKDHKWIIREDNSLLHTGEEQYWLTPDDDYSSAKHLSLKIQLDHSYEQFPYVDSFRYYNECENYLTTDIDECALDSTDGDWCRNSITCECCGEVYYGYSEDELPDGLHWSEWGDGYYCDNCCYWSEYMDDYIPNSVDYALVHRGHYDTDRIPMCELSALLVNDPVAADDVDGPVVKIDNCYYDLQDCKNFIVFNLDTNKYEIRSDSD